MDIKFGDRREAESKLTESAIKDFRKIENDLKEKSYQDQNEILKKYKNDKRDFKIAFADFNKSLDSALEVHFKKIADAFLEIAKRPGNLK